MMKKLQLLFVAMMLLLSVGVNADTIKNSELNLINPDVRKCLLDASSSEGWKLESVYSDEKENLACTREYRPVCGDDGLLP